MTIIFYMVISLWTTQMSNLCTMPCPTQGSSEAIFNKEEDALHRYFILKNTKYSYSFNWVADEPEVALFAIYKSSAGLYGVRKLDVVPVYEEKQETKQVLSGYAVRE